MTLVLIGQRPCFGGFNPQNRGQTGSRYNLNIFLNALFNYLGKTLSYHISNHKNPVALFTANSSVQQAKRLPQAVRFAGGDGGVEGNQGRLVTMNTQFLEETPEFFSLSR